MKEGKGRRVFPGAPEQSLLVLKAANIVPHGGGKQLDPSSEGYQTLVRWISEGMPYVKETDPKLVSSPLIFPDLAQAHNFKTFSPADEAKIDAAFERVIGA